MITDNKNVVLHGIIWKDILEND